MEILDEGIVVYHELKNDLLERIDRDKANSGSAKYWVRRGISNEDSSGMTELYFYNLALIASNELKVSHQISMGLIEMMGEIISSCPVGVQDKIQQRLAELTVRIAEIPF